MADEYRHKIICDPVHGDIGLSKLEQEIVDSPSFQRLRRLNQLGLVPLVYPNANHSRFAHSLGVFHIMSRVIDLLVRKEQLTDEDRRKMRLAALLHDAGHYPYSHLMEYLDRDKHRSGYLIKKGKPSSPSTPARKRYPDHEKVGQLIITQRQDIAVPISEAGLEPNEIASIIAGEHVQPVYNQLIHSSLDMDRMDYLVRDSLGTGVPYGRIDLNYILHNLDVCDGGRMAVSYKAECSVEHFLVARYFMYKTVALHKTVFAFEALMRHILYFLRERGAIYQDGKDIESLIKEEAFLDFHDGYIDQEVDKYSKKQTPQNLVALCKALKRRKPPKLIHEVVSLTDRNQPSDPAYAVFTKDRVDKIEALERKFGIERWRVIWEDPKDLFFEESGPFVELSAASEVDPEETAELVRIKMKDGNIRNLVEDRTSIVYHLARLKFQMSRLYIVGGAEESRLEEIRAEVQSWSRHD
jgi:HD superfamily phosphohydrolase